MVRVIVERNFVTPFATPISPEVWVEYHTKIDHCLEIRDVTWIRSLISQDGYRSICEFEAPYAELIREACREANMPFQSIWRAEIWSAAASDSSLPLESPVVSEVIYEPPMTRQEWDAALQKAAICCNEQNIQRLFSFIAPDRTRSICLYKAASAEAVRTLYRKLGISFEQIWRSQILTP
jgi:hypothetical protein